MGTRQSKANSEEVSIKFKDILVKNLSFSFHFMYLVGNSIVSIEFRN